MCAQITRAELEHAIQEHKARELDLMSFHNDAAQNASQCRSRSAQGSVYATFQRSQSEGSRPVSHDRACHDPLCEATLEEKGRRQLKQERRTSGHLVVWRVSESRLSYSKISKRVAKMFDCGNFPCCVVTIDRLALFERLPHHEDMKAVGFLEELTPSSATPSSANTYFVSQVSASHARSHSVVTIRSASV